MAKPAPELDRNDLMASLSRESMRLTWVSVTDAHLPGREDLEGIERSAKTA
jgi:hypothetical protein